MNKCGYLVVSLDFELLWGIFDVVDYKKKKDYFENTRETIPAILQQFAHYDIHATWAVVGMLFNKNWEEWKKNQPLSVPAYFNSKLSAYDFGLSIESEETRDFVFAPDLIQQINNTKGQEIGTHTYSHYYCLENGQNRERFTADLKKAIEVAAKMGIVLKSLVFPRNQLKEEYLEICAELGVENIRSNPSSWYWKNTLSEAFGTKVARTGDAYLPFGNKTYPVDDLVKKEGFPLEQKASRFFRPVEGNSLLRKLKLERIKKEMTRAAKKKEVYHLWWHPHNFGAQPEESLKDLEILLQHFERCRNKYGFKSLNMKEMNMLFVSS